MATDCCWGYLVSLTFSSSVTKLTTSVFSFLYFQLWNRCFVRCFVTQKLSRFLFNCFWQLLFYVSNSQCWGCEVFVFSGRIKELFEKQSIPVLGKSATQKNRSERAAAAEACETSIINDNAEKRIRTFCFENFDFPVVQRYRSVRIDLFCWTRLKLIALAIFFDANMLFKRSCLFGAYW